MLQRDYFLRILQEFAVALAQFLEKKHDSGKRDREMADLYRQYVGDYELLRNLSVEETMDYARHEWSEDERADRLSMLAELLYAEAGYKQPPLSKMLYDKAYRLYDYLDAHSGTFSLDRRHKMSVIGRILGL